MMCPDQSVRRSVQIHRLVFLAAEVLIKGETVLLASGVLIEEVKVLLGSGMLDGAGRMVLSSVALAGTWCLLTVLKYQI